MRLYYFDRYAGNRNGGYTTEILARAALAREAADGGGRVPVMDAEAGMRRTEKGKPYLPDSPVHFSISHSGALWVLLAAGQPVGVDVQKCEHDNFMAISRRFFQPGEQQAVEEGGLLTFIGIWCRKEAYIKLKGSSLGDTLDWLDVAPEGILLDLAEIQGEKICFRECAVAEGFMCIAASHQEEEIWISKINIE